MREESKKSGAVWDEGLKWRPLVGECAFLCFVHFFEWLPLIFNNADRNNYVPIFQITLFLCK